DQDSIQALYGKKKNPMTTAPPSRHVRSAKIKKSKTTKKQKVTKHKHKQKVTKHKHKQKVTKQKHKQKQRVTKHKQKQKQKATNKRATTETQRTTTEKNIKMTDERQMVTFNASEQARIVKAIKGLQSDGALTEFKNLSETIKLATAKLEMNEEITRLKSQISDYEQKVKQNRDTRRKERGRFWIFSWKVQDVHIDNGERIARENLNRLLDRIRVLEKRLNNWSSRSFTEQMKKATTSLSRYETMKIQLEKEHKNLKELYEQTEQKFHVLIQQIDEIYRSTGTANVKSIKTVNELCFALQTGSESLISACNKIRTHLARIDLDPNSLVDAVLDALQLINMGDEYNDSTKIKDIKRVLALE
ncbi:unnamed protein product, partial [Rotaria magnacalcarata]